MYLFEKNIFFSIQVEKKTGYNVGQQITFQLMQRERGSLMACPVTQFDIRTSQRPVLTVSETCLDTAFTKLLTADTAEVSLAITTFGFKPDIAPHLYI